MPIMSKKSSDKALLEKIHHILDDPSLSSSGKNDDEYLDSLKRRLSSEHGSHPKIPLSQPDSDTNLTPRVIIHKKQEPLNQKKVTKEDEPVLTNEHETEEITVTPASELKVSDDELFEVEKPQVELDQIPEFIEVKPDGKQQDEQTIDEEPLTVTISSETDEDAESLPQWDAVEETEISEEPSEIKKDENSSPKEKQSFIKSRKKRNVEFSEKSKSDDDQETRVKKSFEKNSSIWEPLGERKESTSNDSSELNSISKDESLKKAKESENLMKDDKRSSGKSGFQYGDYTLYQKTITINDKDKRTIHFFAKEVPETGDPTDLPKGYEVKINRKTGVPYIRRKQK